jgi:hypothetical protein
MALVRKFEKIGLQKEKVHGQVDCTYSAFDASDGKRYFQIDTYGSPDREIKGKKSQTIQFDEDAARELFNLIKAEFSF